jgi:hypothetical protein
MTLLLKYPLKYICLALMTLLSCKAAESQSNDDTLQAEIKSKLGNEVIIENSVNGTFALYKQAPGGHAGRVYKYLVVRIADKKIVTEGNYKLGYVKWKDDSTLEVMTAQNNNSSAEPIKKFINLNNNP